MLLRILRGSRTGGPSPLARVLAALVVAGLVALTAPVTLPVVLSVVRWLAGVL